MIGKALPKRNSTKIVMLESSTCSVAREDLLVELVTDVSKVCSGLGGSHILGILGILPLFASQGACQR